MENINSDYYSINVTQMKNFVSEKSKKHKEFDFDFDNQIIRSSIDIIRHNGVATLFHEWQVDRLVDAMKKTYTLDIEKNGNIFSVRGTKIGCRSGFKIC